MTTRIAITAESASGLDSQVCSHFGHSPFFALVDLGDDGSVVKVASVANPYAENHSCGQVVAFIHSQGVDVMVSGGMGGGALSHFNQRGIRVATGATGTVREAIQAYQNAVLGSGECCPGGEGHCH